MQGGVPNVTFCDLLLSGDVTLTGGGLLALTGNDENRIRGAGRLINVDNTIQGTGRIGENLLPITNQGSIIADSAVGSLTIDPNADGMINEGSLQARDGATLASPAMPILLVR